MHPMTFAGRRGDLSWDRGINYDAFLVGWALIAPITLGDLVHVWDFSSNGGQHCKAIKLRPNAALRRKVFIADWTAGAGTLLLALSMVLIKKNAGAAGGVLAILGVALIVGGVVLMFGPARVKKIRRVLGPHGFGSSDPANWGKAIRNDLRSAEEAFNADSYYQLAKEAMDEGEWCLAMWAARLCCALEDPKKGEKLTDAILEESDVQAGLPRIGRSPKAHRKVFGEPPTLEQILRSPPGSHIFRIK